MDVSGLMSQPNLESFEIRQGPFGGKSLGLACGMDAVRYLLREPNVQHLKGGFAFRRCAWDIWKTETIGLEQQ